MCGHPNKKWARQNDTVHYVCLTCGVVTEEGTAYPVGVFVTWGDTPGKLSRAFDSKYFDRGLYYQTDNSYEPEKSGQ